MEIIFIYGIIYVVIFTILQKLSRSISVFRLPVGTGFFPTLISLLASAINLYSFGMVSAMVLSQGEVGLWFVLSISFIAGCMIYVFGPLWAQLDFRNENEFILYRFPTPWGKVLHRFRGIYVGLIVNAIVIGGMMLAFADIMSSFISVSRNTAMYFGFGFVLLNLGRTSLASKVWSDGLNIFLLVLVLVVGYVVSLDMQIDTTKLSPDVLTTFGGFPYHDTPFFTHFVLYACIQWWSAQMFDSSGVNAQRLMGFSGRKIHVLLISYYLCLVLFDVAVALISLKAAGLLTEGKVPEQAMFLFFKQSLPEWIGYIVPIAVFGLFAASVESQLNWAGSLLDSILPERWQRRKAAPFTAMLVIAILAILCALYFDRIYSLVNFILGISAGVSMIFVLRWFVPRINAQVQLSAMVGAILYTFAVNLVLDHWYAGLSDIDRQLYLMVAVTVLVLLTAAVVSALTVTRDDLDAYRTFRASLHFPGPLWKVALRVAALTTGLLVVGFSLFWYLLRL